MTQTSAGQRYAVVFALFGLLTAKLMLLAMGGSELLINILQIQPTVVFASALALVLAWFLGGPTGRSIARGGRGRAIVLGVVLALACLFLTTFVSSVLYFATEWRQRTLGGFAHVVRSGLLGLAVYGGIPAIFLGTIYGAVVRRALSRSSVSPSHGSRC